MLHLLLSIALFIFRLAPISAQPLVDLEDGVQEFVLETKKIEIPGYPHAFNAGIVRWRGCLLMSFRVIPDPAHPFVSRIGLIWLDNNFCAIGKPQLLTTRVRNSSVPSRAEDARLITIGDRLYIVYDDNAEEKITKGGFRMYYGELHFNGNHFTVDYPECISSYEGESRNIREKNWVPFEYSGQLLLAYNLNPHTIFYPIRGRGACETVASTHPLITWNWGILRGGTPALKGVAPGEFLGFFHSSKIAITAHSNGKKSLHYFMGAYTFSETLPFTITKISPEPIIGKGFYNGAVYKRYWGSVVAIYPAGFVFDNDYIWITYGRQDHEIWVVKLDKKGLLKSLFPVS